MSVIGATFLGIVIIWVLVTLSARDDEKKKKKRIRTYKESYKKEIDTFYKDKLPYQEYIQSLYQSKMALSPFGQGEVCYRDFEIPEFGVVMIKPTMDRVKTNPNPYIANETYIPVDLDWKELNDKVLEMISKPDKLQSIVENSRKVYDELYSAHNFCMYWYNFFNSLSGVENE